MDWKATAKSVKDFSEFKPTGARTQRTARDVLARSLDKQIGFVSDPAAEGRRWFTTKGENSAFTVRFANRPLKLKGEETELVVPTKQLAEIFGAIKADALKGDFDTQLAGLEKMISTRNERMAETRAGKGKTKKR